MNSILWFSMCVLKDSIFCLFKICKILMLSYSFFWRGVKSCLFLFWVCGRCMCTFHTFVEMCAQVFKPQKVSPCESMQPVFLQYNYNIKEDVIEFYCKESHLDEDKV